MAEDTKEPQDKASPLLDPLEQNIIAPPKVTPDDKEKFFKCFMAEQPYTEKVSLFGGKFVIEFKGLTVEENDDIMKQIAMDQEKGLAKSNDSYFINILQYRLAACIVSLNNVPFQKEVTKENFPYNFEENTFYIKSRISIFETWPTAKLAAVTDAFRQFENKLNYLTKEATNEDFWKAAA